MGRRKNWLTLKEWRRTPHSDWPAEGLWWYRSLPEAKREEVIIAYLKQYSRGRALPEGFRDDLDIWLCELNTEQRIAPRTRRFWTIPSYAIANRLHTKMFCKRFRELEKIAKRLFPDLIPVSRITVTLTDEKVEAIRARFTELSHDMDAFPKVAKEFGIEPFRVGQLCKDLKADAIKEREQPTSGSSSTLLSDERDPFDDEPF